MTDKGIMLIVYTDGLSGDDEQALANQLYADAVRGAARYGISPENVRLYDEHGADWTPDQP